MRVGSQGTAANRNVSVRRKDLGKTIRGLLVPKETSEAQTAEPEIQKLRPWLTLTGPRPICGR
jgi:hypothetical protein